MYPYYFVTALKLTILRKCQLVSLKQSLHHRKGNFGALELLGFWELK